MIFAVCLSSEALLTSIQALVGSFVSVDLHVDLKVRFFGEGFTTTWVWTPVTRNSIVPFQMIPETMLASENFVASI